MNERSIVEAPEPGGRSLWYDQYLPEPYAAPTPQSSRIDVAWIRGAIFRQRWLIVAVLALAFIVGIVITLLSTPVYEATATARVNPNTTMIVEGQDAAGQVVGGRQIDDYLATQIETIQSRSMAATVARDLDLGNRPALLGAAVDEGRPPNVTDEKWAERKIMMAAERLRSGVSASVVNNAFIIGITYSSSDPVLAAQVANGYLEAFARSDVRRGLDANAYAREYLLEQINDVRQQLNDAEMSSNTYARSAGIVTQQTASSDEGGGLTITGSNLASINQTVSAARAARISAEQKWRAIANIPAGEIPEVLNSPVVQDLTSERAKLNAELTVLRQRYNDEFPVIVDIRSRLGLINQQIERTGADIKASIRSEYLIARQQEQALDAELNSVTNEALVEQDKKIEFSGLAREAEALREQLKSLLDRYNQVSTASNVQSSTIIPLDPATVPAAPVSPSLTRNLILAFIMGLGLAGGLALVREIFVDQFRRTEDVEDRLGLISLGLTPHVKAKDLESEEANQFSTLMEAYAAIRSTIDYAISRNGAVIQMTSSQASEGKTTTSLILAQLFARLGRKTLLIDGDLRKPSIHALLDIERPAMGVVEVILGHVSFDEAKIESVADNLTVLSVAGIPPDPVELISSQNFRDFIEARRKEFSLIIIDSSPMLGLADAAEVARNVDNSIFVIEANRTSVAQARTAVKRLRAVGANVMGAILTKYRTMDAGADYGYQYQYYHYGKD